MVYKTAVWAVHRNSVLLVKNREHNKWLPVMGRLGTAERPINNAIWVFARQTGLEVYCDYTLADPHDVSGLLGYREFFCPREGDMVGCFDFVASFIDKKPQPVPIRDTWSAARWVKKNDPFLTRTAEWLRNRVLQALQYK